MKIALTGHTGHFGKNLFELLSTNYEVIGLSRSNGYNIVNTDKIISKIDDADIFINNVYKEKYQSELFVKVFDKWKNLDKTIININSSSVYHSGEWAPEYSENKKHLRNTMLNTISKNENKKVRVCNIYPSTISGHSGFDKYNKIDVSHLSKIIKFIIEQPQEIEIREISIYSTISKKELKINSFI